MAEALLTVAVKWSDSQNGMQPSGCTQEKEDHKGLEKVSPLNLDAQDKKDLGTVSPGVWRSHVVVVRSLFKALFPSCANVKA